MTYCGNLGCTNEADGKVRRKTDGQLVWSCERCADANDLELIESVDQ